MNDHIAKPVDPNKFYETLLKWSSKNPQREAVDFYAFILGCVWAPSTQ
jgi:hypothetical protein